MRAWAAIDDGFFSELFKCSIDEVIDVFNNYRLFIKEKDYSNWEVERLELRRRDDEELEKLKEYCDIEFPKLKENKKQIGFEDSPEFKAKVIDSRTRNALANMIIKYFDKDTFLRNRNKINIVKQDQIQNRAMTEVDLVQALYSLKGRIHTFLYTIGILQQQYHCFFSNDTRYSINIRYSNAVKDMNKNVCEKLERFYDIFNYKQKKDLDEQDAFLPDNISIINLITPYLKININELIDICGIIKKYKKYDDESKKARINEINHYVSSRINSGVIKRI